MPCGGGTVVGFQVRGEIPKDAHGNFPNFPADLGRDIENQKTVNSRLIATRVTWEMDVKRVAVAGVVVEGRRKLEVRDVRKVKLRSNLPA